MANDLITELNRLHHRATDMRARERQLADAGENDPASDAWKTAAILAASAESEFEIALVEAWPAVARLLREAEQWRTRESETQEPPMQKTEQRAFAAVHEDGDINLTSISSEIELAKQRAGANWRGGWVVASFAGWRIRPVLIRVEDEGEGR